MGLKTNGVIGIIGGILLILAIPYAIVITATMYDVPASDLLNPAKIGGGLFAFIVTGIAIDAISGLILIVVGALIASGRGGTSSAICMIIFGVLGIVFSIAAIGGIVGIVGGILGIVGGALSRRELQTRAPTGQETPLAPQ